MAAWAITEDGRAYGTVTRCRTEDGAIRRLLRLMVERLGCFEVRSMGVAEITPEWLMARAELL